MVYGDRKKKAEQIADLCTEAIAITLQFNGTYAEFKTLKDFETFYSKSYNALKGIWPLYDEEEERFIDVCREFLANCQQIADLNEKVVSAAALVVFLDEKVTYEPENSVGKIDLSPLINTDKVVYYEAGHLNSDQNLETTGI